MTEDYLYSATNEKYIEHILNCQNYLNKIYPLFESVIFRVLNIDQYNKKNVQEAFEAMIIYHDLGKLTEQWQKNLKENKRRPVHATIGAAYLWKTLPQGLKEPISFAVAIHHTDSGLLSDNIERPDVQAIKSHIVDNEGKIKWAQREGAFEELKNEGFFNTEINSLTIYDLKKMARELREWARGRSLNAQHHKRLQVALCHHILKLCDVSAAGARKDWENETCDPNNLYGGWIMVDSIKKYVENKIKTQKN
ncbi:MAG: CRISPR-associated endonuclease Cas3'' [candidate division WOR-3 bacterium]|nr:CRISPR-associated endonuclease Cas3'' [candidate division WOR-3 bacterium]MCX7757919.1 CRISPR-associated endonuclease Cas3'' [candidate division WOR-3 bacterium]MDW7987813.1 CRISPR-associated endonuclease Cas3'' [candidate division WOR-3 bacterium]